MTYPVTTGDLISAADWNGLHHEIQTISLGTGNAASFTNPVPTGFRHLMVRAEGAIGGSSGDVGLRMNGITTGYEHLRVDVNAAGTQSVTTAFGASRIHVALWNSTYGELEFTIFDYNSTSDNAIVGGRSSRAHPSSTTGMVVSQTHGRHPNADAITRVDLVSVSGVNFAGGSATLYGIP